jgi:hypothetical protein
MVFLGDAQFQTSPFRSIFWFRLTFQELIKNISHFHTLSSFSFTFSGTSRTPGHPLYQRGRSIWCTCGTKFAENMVQTSKLKVSRKLARVFTKRPDAWKPLHQFHMGINSLPFHGTWPPRWKMPLYSASPPVRPQFSPPAPAKHQTQTGRNTMFSTSLQRNHDGQ